MKPIDFLSVLGVLVAVGSQAWVRYGKTLPGPAYVYWIAAAVLVAANIVLRWEDLGRAIGGRRLRYGGNFLAQGAAVLILVVAVNYIASRPRYQKQWDFTKSQRLSLSDETLRILEGLKDDVSIVYFQTKAALGDGAERMQRFEAGSSHIKVEYVDPLPNPARVEAYDVRPPYPVLILERGGKREVVRGSSEQDIANALIKVTRDEQKTICFAEGRDVDDTTSRGYSNAKEALEKLQYQVKKVSLLREKLADTCTVAVVAGPEKDLLAPAVDALRQFVKGGGKVFLMVEPETKEKYPELVALLKEWSVEAGSNFIVDEAGWSLRSGPLAPVVARDLDGYTPHEITRKLGSLMVFPLARSVDASQTPAAGVSVQPLARTAEMSWIENGLKLAERTSLEREELTFDPTVDRPGPHTLAVAVTVRGPEPAPVAEEGKGADTEKDEKTPEGRVVVTGDADFASNGIFGFRDNQDFFVNSVAWLSADADLISIRQREPDDQKLFLSEGQTEAAWWLAFVILPGACALAGVFAWWRRR